MPYQPLVLGLRFKITVADLEASDLMVLRCSACGWGCRVAPHVLIDRYRVTTRLIDLERDLRCRRCGGRGNLGWHLERAVPPEFPRIV